MATNETDAFTWIPHRVELKFCLGEIQLFAFAYDGIRSDPDIFASRNLKCVEPPIINLNRYGRRVAYIYSCPIAVDLPRYSLTRQHIRFISSSYRHFFIQCDGDFGEYLSKLKKKTLETLKRKVKKAQASNTRGEFFVTYERPEDMDAFFDAAQVISARSFQERLLGQGLPTTSEFRDEVKLRAKSGKVFGYILYVEDTPAAYCLCPIYGENVVLYDHSGYDPQFSRYSPGTVLQFKVIEGLFASSQPYCYDLCTGEGRHKELFATGEIRCANVYFFPLKLRHLAGLGLRSLLDSTNNAVKFCLNTIGLKSRVKRLVRRTWH
jgi:CelD/BcsL family acetyltransferase involved in cellulose biosynthesis